MERPSDGSYRPVDVVIGFCLETLREGIVFVMADVLAGFPEIVEGGMQPARLIRDLIHPRVIVQVLSVVDRSLLDLIDGCVDPADCLLLIDGLLPVARAVLDHPACGAEIG
jgi:hypothetical protein